MGNKGKWIDLYLLNKDTIGPDPNILWVGVRLRVDEPEDEIPEEYRK